MRRSRRGFTLIEILVVIGIILVLMGIVVLGYRHLHAAGARRETIIELKTSSKGWNEFDLVTCEVDVPLTPRPRCAPQRKHSAFPRMMEYRLVLFFFDRAHALHATHIVHAIHTEDTPGVHVSFATPTIESRVTSAANCSSLNCSVPAGRSGKTR